VNRSTFFSDHPAVTLSFPYRAFCRVFQLIRFSSRKDMDLAIEVVMLCHELSLLRRQVDRPALQAADRALLAGLARLLTGQRWGGFFVQPETLLRWHRDLVRRRWTHTYRSREHLAALPGSITPIRAGSCAGSLSSTVRRRSLA
jgi:hypothetical protein